MTGDRVKVRGMKQLSLVDRLTKPRRPWRIAGIAAAAVVIAGGLGVGAAVAAPIVFPTPKPTPTVAFVPVAQTGSVNRAPAVTSAQQQTADAAAAKMLADQQGAAAAAAAQAVAAKAAAVKTVQAPSGPIRCPVGSQANSGDAGNDTSCLPVICFHIVLPDPAHPECNTPFKP